MRKIHKVIAAAGVAALGVVGITVAANAAGGTGCRTLTYPLCARSVSSTQVVDNSLISNDLHPSVRAAIKAGQDPKGEVTDLESDGPYPGSTKLQDYPGNGANSTAKVPADGKSHAVWVMCAEGKTALGGGFRVGADQGDAVASKIQVTASEPTQIKDGKVVYVPIEGDKAGSLEPNGWLVEAINSSDVDATVRPWVTCATVAK
ncbi:MAG TPA: hypothetical protein VIQ79_09530 [Kribbella sp.]